MNECDCLSAVPRSLAPITDVPVSVCLSSSAWPRGSVFPRAPQALTCVSVAPTIADDQTDFTVTVTAPVVLTCHTSGMPAPVVSWSKAGTRLGVRGNGYRVLPSGEEG